MDPTYYCAPANFSNDTTNEETVITTDVMNQIDSGIMIDENTKLINVDNTYNDLLILKHDLLKYLKNEKIYFDEELEINIEKQIDEQKTQTKLNSLYSKFKTRQEEIEVLFKKKEESIKQNGGQNVKSGW